MGCWRYLALCAILALAVDAEEKLRLCATQEDAPDSSCNDLQRQNSPLKCQRVIDSTECAIQLADGRADFGLFTADELLLTHHFYPTGIQVVAEVKNKDKMFEPFEFQSVVVVSKGTSSEEGFRGLYGSGLCHPGFSQTQMWNDHALKYFEQKIMNKVCRNDTTVAENEIINLRDFFKKGCRPGEWVLDKELDKELKKKYPELCELCDSKETCQYNNRTHHGHVGALECLTSGRGQVAYASLQYVKDHFAPNQSSRKMSDYQFLCKNGSMIPLDSPNPCTWFKQPWKVILAREEKANEVLEKLEKTSKITYSSLPWEMTLNSILFNTDSPITCWNYTSPAHYLSRAKDDSEVVELPRSECGRDIRWCTISDMETSKCNWTSAAARALGIQPSIDCVQSPTLFDCFEKISKNEADIITIDSNYGHLARKVYGLRPILFSETLEDKNSVVVAVIRDNAQMRRISSLAELKDSNACFPEYGGIAWLSFINVAREHRVLPDSCKYPQIVSNLLHAACTPGFSEASHSLKNMQPRLKADNLENLCDLCPTQANGERCEANSENTYYGDKGAIDCLKIGIGDIAFLESRNIKVFTSNGSIKANDYRVLCKNGTLAEYTGFDVDENCAFSVTIDSEVVSRGDRAKPELRDTTLALLKIESWLGYRSGERRAIRIYDRFNGTENLLFKDSSNGLVSIDSDVKSVLAYKELFKHVDECNGAASVFAAVSFLLLNFLVARYM